MNDLRYQKELIRRKDWDCLIILDACRYDFFEGVYEDFLEGDLEKAYSEGSCTSDWVRETFGNENFEDTVYVSANPYINSKTDLIDGIKLSERFYEIIDVWDKGWDDERKTVLPGKVRKATTFSRAKYPNKRLISHFMQPHDPYLSIESPRKGIYGGFKMAEEGKNEGFLKKIKDKAWSFMVKTLGPRLMFRMGDLLSLREPTRVESVAREDGDRELRQLYMKNLFIVLKEVKKMIKDLPERVVVTSDHGELLGEDGFYEHPRWLKKDTLREVPWLEVERSKSS